MFSEAANAALVGTSCDAVAVTADCLRTLLQAHQDQADGRITVPVVDGVRGNPIALPAAQRTRMLADPVNLGCRKLTRTSPELVHMFETTDHAVVVDIDTPEDFAQVRLGPH